MITFKPKFLFDLKGNKEAVMLPIEDFEKILEELENFEDTKAAILAKKQKNATFISLQELKKNYHTSNG